MYHQSFKAIKYFSMRIACSSLSKTERSDSQSHFLPNPIKGGEGRGKKRGWRLKMEGFYLRTRRYYRPDYSWLMFLVWEITFPLFFWSAQPLESKMRITLSLSCFSLLHFSGLFLFLLLCFARKISVFPLLLAPTELLDTSRGVFLGLGFMSILSGSFKGNYFFIPRSSLNYW